MTLTRRPSRIHTTQVIVAATLSLLAGFVAEVPASAQVLQWVREFGGPGLDVARAVGADTTGVYAFGATSTALPGQSYAGGPDDLYLRKYDFGGNELWTHEFGTAGDDFPVGGEVAIDGSAVYVGGLTNGALVSGIPNAGDYDIFVRRYDTDGNVIWTDQFGGSDYDEIEGIAAFRGKVFVAGSTQSALPGQVLGGGWDGLVRAYDSNGHALWTRQFGGRGSEGFHSIAVDETGIYVAGRISPGRNFTANDWDALVVKYDFGGNVVWVRQFGTQGRAEAEGAAVWHGQLYVAGFVARSLPGQVSAGGDDIFVRKYDPDGNVVWTRQFGTPGDDSGSARRLTASARGVYLSGTVASGWALPGQTSAGGLDSFVRLYSHNGDELWTTQFGTGADDRASSAPAVDQDGGVYLGGAIEFGAFPGYTNAGGRDAFVAKITTGNQ